MKLNIGDGGIVHPDYIGVDIQRGQDATTLDWLHSSLPGEVDEIRASHILEHFPQAQIQDVLREWVRVLKPGGVLKIAVPDFRILAEQFLAGAGLNFQGYVMGGQIDQHDFHKTMFDEGTLRERLQAVGLLNIRVWKDDIEDCSRLPISLNLCGTKPPTSWPSAYAVVSLPRLGFNDFWDCAITYLKPFMPLRRITGAYWEWNMEQAIDQVFEEANPEWILTADYDSVFTQDHIMALLDLAARHPEADAIAPLQSSRSHNSPMMTVADKDGKVVTQIDRSDLDVELLPAASAHFGLTLLRASKLRALPKPWFFRTWGADQRDPDVNFWHHWKQNGNTLFTAMRVPIGHCELMVRWPDHNLETIHQQPREFFKEGPPAKVWQ